MTTGQPQHSGVGQLLCHFCDATFPANVHHDCSVTRREFRKVQADIRLLASILHSLDLAHWKDSRQEQLRELANDDAHTRFSQSNVGGRTDG